MSKFSALLARKTSRIKKFAIGDMLPVNQLYLQNEKNLLLFLSLGCAYCVKFITEMKNINLDGVPTIIFISASEEEKLEVTRYLNNNHIKIVSIDEDDFLIYGVSDKPFAYLLSMQGEILAQKSIREISELILFLK